MKRLRTKRPRTVGRKKNQRRIKTVITEYRDYGLLFPEDNEDSEDNGN